MNLFCRMTNPFLLLKMWVSYKSPNWHFISRMAIQNKYKQVYEFISKCLENVAVVSYTTDIWSTDMCPMSLLSLTAQRMDSSFTLQKAVLQAKQFRGSNT